MANGKTISLIKALGGAGGGAPSWNDLEENLEEIVSLTLDDLEIMYFEGEPFAYGYRIVGYPTGVKSIKDLALLIECENTAFPEYPLKVSYNASVVGYCKVPTPETYYDWENEIGEFYGDMYNVWLVAGINTETSVEENIITILLSNPNLMDEYEWAKIKKITLCKKKENPLGYLLKEKAIDTLFGATTRNRLGDNPKRYLTSSLFDLGETIENKTVEEAGYVRYINKASFYEICNLIDTYGIEYHHYYDSWIVNDVYLKVDKTESYCELSCRRGLINHSGNAVQATTGEIRIVHLYETDELRISKNYTTRTLFDS